MNYCIYLKDNNPNLTFESGEHIFPAGLGGIKKLPKGYVSDQLNNKFSAIETEFMRRSPIMLPRQFEGPGKRGNLNIDSATKSEVALMHDLNSLTGIEFGYISLGKPYTLPQMKIDINGECSFTVDTSFGDSMAQFNIFISRLKNFKNKYKIYEDTRINEGSFLICFEKRGKEKTWHLAFNSKEHGIDIKKQIGMILNQVDPNVSSLEPRTMQPRVNQRFKVDINAYCRVNAKTAFNFLSYVKGQEFVLQDCFDPIRKWIANGGENNFVRLTKEGDSFEQMLKNISFPDASHKIIIVRIKKVLYGYVSFYGDSFGTLVKLCNTFTGNFEMDGFICDWKNRKEYPFLEYIEVLNNSM